MYRQIIGYGMSVDAHSVVDKKIGVHDINWGALDHASCEPQLTLCICVCV